MHFKISENLSDAALSECERLQILAAPFQFVAPGSLYCKTRETTVHWPHFWSLIDKAHFHSVTWSAIRKPHPQHTYVMRARSHREIAV